MAEPYLNDLRAIVGRTALGDDANSAIECKHFFSGAAACMNGGIFMTLTTVGLALKLPERDRNSLFLVGGKQVRYFPKSPIKREYVVLPKVLVDDNRALGKWVANSVAFAEGRSGMLGND